MDDPWINPMIFSSTMTTGTLLRDGSWKDGRQRISSHLHLSRTWSHCSSESMWKQECRWKWCPTTCNVKYGQSRLTSWPPPTCVHFQWKTSRKTLEIREGFVNSPASHDLRGSRSSDIDELVLLVFGGWILGMVTCYCRNCQDWSWVQITFRLFGFSLSWNGVLSHGWIHVVSKVFLSRTS